MIMERGIMHFFMITIVCSSLVAAFCSPVMGLATPDAGKETIAARVNGKPIYLGAVKGAIDSVTAKYRKFGGTVAPETLKRVTHEELEQQVRQELLAQAAEKFFTPDEMEQMVNARINSQSLPSPYKTGGKDSADLQNGQALRRQVLVDEYLASCGLHNVQVPDGEPMDYYRQHGEQFREGETVKVSHILLALPRDASSDDVKKTKTKIEELLDDLRKGKPFEELAKVYSDCSSAGDGGNLGYIRRRYMPQEFDEVAFRLKIGETGKVARTRHGFHLIRVYDRKESAIPEFPKVKGLIEKILLKKAQVQKVEEIVQQLRREAKVEFYLD